MASPFPYEQHYRSQQASGGQRTCWQLNFVPNARITKVVIRQVGGMSTPDFTLDLFNSRRACSGPSESSGGGDPDGFYSAHPDLYRICPTMNGSGGNLTEYLHDRPMTFRNMDGQPPAIREPYLYLEIEIPGASGDFTYDVAIGADIPQAHE